MSSIGPTPMRLLTNSCVTRPAGGARPRELNEVLTFLTLGSFHRKGSAHAMPSVMGDAALPSPASESVSWCRAALDDSCHARSGPSSKPSARTRGFHKPAPILDEATIYGSHSPVRRAVPRRRGHNRYRQIYNRSFPVGRLSLRGCPVARAVSRCSPSQWKGEPVGGFTPTALHHLRSAG
jgi:hypothetical protein